MYYISDRANTDCLLINHYTTKQAPAAVEREGRLLEVIQGRLGQIEGQLLDAMLEGQVNIREMQRESPSDSKLLAHFDGEHAPATQAETTLSFL